MIAKSDMPSLNDKPPEGQKPDGGSYRVLVVDDSMFIAKQLGQIFTSEGFEVAATAADGAQGVEKYKELHPNIDLVTMDITMPVMDGVTALEKILEFDKNAVVIMVSALGKEDVVKKSLLMGAKSYIVKPLDRKKVLERVVSVLKR
jgi:two-component system chemotaxis response regulator CheY